MYSYDSVQVTTVHIYNKMTTYSKGSVLLVHFHLINVYIRLLFDLTIIFYVVDNCNF